MCEGRDWAGRAWRGPLLSGRSGPVGGLVLAVQSDLKNVRKTGNGVICQADVRFSGHLVNKEVQSNYAKWGG
jgi:hypothetical protein